MYKATAAFLSVLFFVSAFCLYADVPRLINYQGRLTDPAGNPVADDLYNVKFTLWNDPVLSDPGNLIWTCDYQKVSTTDGLFTYTLGENIALPANIFDYDTVCYLGIQISGEASEVSPRTRIVSSAFAFHAVVADYVLGDPYLNEAGDTLRGSLFFDGNGLGTDGLINIFDDASSIKLYQTGIQTVTLYGELYGSLYLRDADGTFTAELDATGDAGGSLRLSNTSGTSRIFLDAGDTGTNSVVLPESAISDIEIEDEPGIASASAAGTAILTSTTTMQNIETIDITIPHSGYIVIQAKAWGYTNNTTGISRGRVQIDETSGGTFTYPYCTGFGLFGNVTTDGSYFPIFVQRVYYKSTAGTYTFILEGMQSNGNDVNADIQVWDPYMVAMYFPTSYGSVESVVSSSELVEMGDITYEKTTIEREDYDGGDSYEVDLRQLELRAREARIKALEAELELKQAQDRANDKRQ